MGNPQNQDWMHSDEYDNSQSQSQIFRYHELEEQTELRSGDGQVDSLLDFDEKNNKLISDECYFFHCPYCDFKADDQLLMGDHVVINHVKEHISRNAKPPETHDCSLCHKKAASLNLLQDHVRSEHPDVVVI